jgi:hypothetical protein
LRHLGELGDITLAVEVDAKADVPERKQMPVRGYVSQPHFESDDVLYGNSHHQGHGFSRIITTSHLARGAEKAATREGAPHIDLISGQLLIELLRLLKLGVKTEMVERVVVDESWFKAL